MNRLVICRVLLTGQDRTGSKESYKKSSSWWCIGDSDQEWRATTKCRARSSYSHNSKSSITAESGLYYASKQSNSVVSFYNCQSNESDQSNSNGCVSERLPEPINTGATSAAAVTVNCILHSITHCTPTIATARGNYFLRHGSSNFRGRIGRRNVAQSSIDATSFSRPSTVTRSNFFRQCKFRSQSTFS